MTDTMKAEAEAIRRIHPHILDGNTEQADAWRAAERQTLLSHLASIGGVGSDYVLGWIGGVANSELPAEQKVARILGACDAMTQHRRGRLSVVKP